MTSCVRHVRVAFAAGLELGDGLQQLMTTYAQPGDERESSTRSPAARPRSVSAVRGSAKHERRTSRPFTVTAGLAGAGVSRVGGGHVTPRRRVDDESQFIESDTLFAPGSLVFVSVRRSVRRRFEPRSLIAVSDGTGARRSRPATVRARGCGRKVAPDDEHDRSDPAGCRAEVRGSNGAAGRRSFVLLRRAGGAVEPRRQRPRRGGRPAGRSRCALRPELLGVARRLLRHRQDRRGRDPGQRHAHAGRGPLRRRGLRDAGRGRVGGQGRAAARSARHREPPGRRPVGRRRPAGGDRVRRLALARVAGVQPGRARRRRPGGDLLHVGDDRPPEGRDAAAPRGDRRRRGHGGDGGARARRPRHQLAAAAARLRVVRVQRRHDGRLDADHDPALRRRDRAARDRRAPRDADGRRADRLLLPARPPGLRLLRPVEPDALLGRRPDAAGGQGDRVHRAHRLPDPRGLGHDRARRRHQREPGDRARTSPARSASPTPATRCASSTSPTRRARCRSASAAS